MEDDLLSSLSRQVKEDVVENYLRERRLVEYQIEDLKAMAKVVDSHAAYTGMRLTRLAYLMVDEKMWGRLRDLIKVEPDTFWCTCIEDNFQGPQVRLIHVMAFTTRGKYQKLVYEAYNRFYLRMKEYREKYDKLEAMLRGVNFNIKKFMGNFDLLTIINFLKSMDVCLLENQKVLGCNFTGEEICSIESKLCFRPLTLELLNLEPPLDLPAPRLIEDRLNAITDDVWNLNKDRIRKMMR